MWRIGIVFLLATFGCLASIPVPMWPPPHLRVFPSSDGRLELHLDLPRIIASDDTISAKVSRRDCQSDLCMARAEAKDEEMSWRSDRSDVASVTARGGVIGHRPGWVWISAVHGDTVLRRHIQVIGRVATLVWEPNVQSARVGDTIRVKAVARDSAGGEVAIIPASIHEGGEGTASLPTLIWGGPNGTVFVVGGPGSVVLIASLGRRTATLRVAVTER